MKINESCINHNALRLIEKTIDCYSDAILNDDDEQTKMWLLDMVSRIDGIIAMADALKKVEKV